MVFWWLVVKGNLIKFSDILMIQETTKPIIAGLQALLS
jgi:hypothetical protein